MAAGQEIDARFISILPSFRNFGKQVDQAVSGEAKRAGQQFGKSFSSGTSNAVTAIADLQKAQAKAVQAATVEIKKARQDQEATARKVTIEEKKLEEVRANGKAKASQVLQAEDRVANARRKNAEASGKLAAATTKATELEQRHKTELSQTSAELRKAGGSYDDLGRKIKNAAGVKPNFKGVASDAEKAGRNVGSRFATAASSATKKGMKGLGRVLKGSLIGIAGAAIAGAGAAVKKGWDRLTAIEGATKQLEGLKYSAQEAADIIKGPVLAAVKGTAYGLDEAAQAAQGALGAGVEMGKGGKGLESYLRLVADATTQSTTDFNSMALMMNKVEGAGKLTGDVLNQMAENGLQVMPMLTKALGKPQEEIRKMVSKGEISAKQFREILEENIGGASAKSGETTVGAFKNMNAALGRVGASFLEGVFPMFGDGFGKITEWLDKITPAAEAFGAALSDKLKGAVEVLAPFFTQLADGAKVFFAALSGNSEVDELDGSMRTVSEVGTTLRSVFDAVAPVVQNMFQSLAGAAGPLVESFQKDVMPVLRQFGDFLIGAGKTIIPIVLQVVGKVVDGIRELAPTAMEWIKTLMGVVAAALPPIMQVVKTVIDTIKEQLPVIMPIIDDIVETIKNVMAIIIRQVRGAVDMFLRIWKALAPVLLPMIKSMIKGIVSIVGGLVRTIKGIIKVVTGIFTGDFSKMKDGVKDIFSGLVQVIKAPVIAVRDWLSEVFGKFRPMIKDKLDAAVRAFSTAWDALKKKAGQPIRFIIDTVINKGLLEAFNWVVRKLPGDNKESEIPPFAIPAGLARGGILPGYRPMGQGDDQLRPMRSGEGVLVSEGLRDSQSRDLFLRANAAARRGTSFADFLGGGFAYGGIVPGPGRQHTSGYPWATWAGDFPNPMGTPVKSWKDGLIAAVRYLTTSYGQHVRINHDDGSSSLYAHLSKILVSVGDRVRQGQTIGKVGSTGNSSGPHLHFEAMGGAFKPSAGVGGDFTNSKGGGFDPLGALADRFAPAMAKLSEVGKGPIAGIIKSVPKALKTMITDKVKNSLADLVGTVGDTVGTARWTAVATEALLRNGQLTPGNLTSLLRRMKQESGGNPRAINNWDSNAANGTPSKGLMQVIDPTFATHRDPKLKNDIWDPLANISASIRYALARYGSLKSAYDRPGGYANGTLNAVPGMHWVGEQGPELMSFRGGETVIPHRQSMQIAGLSKWMAGSGREVVAGLIWGMDQNRAAAETAATRLAFGTAQAARDELGIASPSKVFTQVGRWVSEGLAKGIRASADKVTSTIQTLRTNMEKVWTDQNQRRKSSLVERWSDEVKRLKPLVQSRSKLVKQIAATEKKIRTARDAKNPNKKRISTLQAELTGLRSALAGKDYSKALKNAEKQLAAARKIDPNRGVAKSWAAFSKQIRRQTQLLKQNAKQRTRMAERLKKAESSLLEARRTRNDYRREVRGAAVDSASVVGQSKFSQSLIASKLRDTLSSWRTFGSNLKRLRKMGLADQAYQELIAAGPDEGGQVAKSLLQSGKRGVAEINDLQRQIRKAGDSIGHTASNQLYQSGVEAAAGLVQGLRSKQKELDKVGVSLAKSLVRAVKKELKIKSPSRVMFEAGAFTTEGFALGMGAEQKKVMDASARLASAAVPSLAGVSSSTGGGLQPGQHVSISVIDRDGTFIDRMDGRIDLHQRAQSVAMRRR